MALNSFLSYQQSVNRMLLHWLKQWDHVVFGKEIPAVKDKQKSKGKEAQTNNKGFKKFQPEVSTELDAYKRPVQKGTILHFICFNFF
jgi:chromosome transmission fidelity protein 18